MGLDITIKEVGPIYCPDCGRFVAVKEVDEVNSGGRVWYDFLEDLGYYVPHDQLNETNDWYGKDMLLDAEQVQYLLRFAANQEPAEYMNVERLVAHAIGQGNRIVINADW